MLMIYVKSHNHKTTWPYDLSIKWTANHFEQYRNMPMKQLFFSLIPPTNNLEINLYFDSATQILQGQTPYLDFNWLYPPGHLLIATILKFFFPDITSFIFSYFLILLTSGIFIFYKLYQNAATQKLTISKPKLQIFTILISTFLLLTVNKTFINPDLLVSAIILTAFLKRKKTNLALFLLGTATAIRLYPAIFILLFIKKLKLKNLLIFATPFIFSLLIFFNLQIFPAFVNQSIIAQANRQVEIESFTASLMRTTGQPLQVIPDDQQYDLKLQFIKIPKYWDLLQFLTWMPLVFTLYYFYRMKFKPKNSKEFYAAALILILSLIIKHSVFSPQYLIWIWVPYFLWLLHPPLARGGRGGLTKLTTLSLFLLIHLLTTFYLTSFLPQNLPILITNPNSTLNVIILRNFLILALFIIIYQNSTKQLNNETMKQQTF